jgi:phage-related minor tail protein
MSTLADLLIEIGLDAKEVVKGAGEVEGKLKKTWAGVQKAAAIGGAAVGAALLAGIDQVVEQAKPMALLEAQLGGSDEFASQMGKNAGAVYTKGVVDSMDEAAGAVRDVWQNKLIPEDAGDAAIQNVSSKLVALGKTTESSTKEVATAVSTMLKTGLAGSAAEAFDIIQRGVEKGVNKADDLLDTFTEYSTQFRKLGIDGQTAMGLLSQGLKGGARDADTVADALKELSIRAIDGSATTQAGYKLLGLSAKETAADFAAGGDRASGALATVLDKLKAIKDPVKQQAAAVDLFGTKAEDLGAALFKLDPKTAVAGLGKLAGAADKAGDRLENNAGAKLESFKRQAQAALVDQLAKAIPAIEATFGWLQKNSDWVVPLATGLGVLAGVIGIVTAVQWAWNVAMAANPIGLIVAAILLLIGIIVLVATKTKFFQTIWEAVWGFLKMIGAWFAGPFANFFVAAWQKIWGFLKAVGAWFAGPFANFFVQLWQKIVAFAKGVWTVIKMYFTFWINIYKTLMSWATSAVVWMVNKFTSFVNFIRSIPGKIRGALSSMWDGLKAGFRSAINWVIGKWNGLHFSIPSFSVLGHTFGGGTIGVPHIPQLADGGLVKSRAGGTLVNVGEGGQDEAVVPLDRMPSLGARDDRPIVVQITPGGEQEFRRWIRKSFRVKNGGNGTVSLA